MKATLFSRQFFYRACLSVTAILLCVACFSASVFSADATITVPAEVGINQSFDIQFTGPNAKGDMLRIADTTGKLLGGHYVYVGNLKNNVGKLSAPVEPGDYQVAYVSNHEIIASAALRVIPVTASVGAPASASVNATIEVRIEGPLNSGDYLQFVDASGKPVRGSYQYVANARDGRLKLRAPVAAGSYTLAYFTGRRNIGSTPITVTGVEATLAMATEVYAGAHFQVQWQGPDNNGDMLRVLLADGSNAGSYTYVGLSPATATLRAPEQLGKYRVVYLTGHQQIGEVEFEVVDVTAELTAPAQAEGNLRFNVTWEGPGNHGDTIQLVDPATQGTADYEYLDKRRGNIAVFLAPDVPGNYELRYMTQGKRLLATRAITITPAKLKPGSLQVVAEPNRAIDSRDAVEVVLDASGSMLQRQDGERRIDIARRTLIMLIRETIPEGTPFALRVFGHKEADKCRTDLELSLAPLNRIAATSKLSGIMAMNLAKTPIADSLAQTEADLRGASGERIIVLVTDGEETCDGDPAEVIAGMRARSADVRVNIVGYAIDEGGLKDTFARWAKLGGGQYFDVAGETELAAALTTSVNPTYVVRDMQGVAVSSGLAGGKPVTLAAGDYQVIAGAREYKVKILPEQRSSVVLD